MRRISSVMVVLAMVGAVAGAPLGSTWAAEPAHQIGYPLFGAPRSMSWAGETPAGEVTELERATLTALRAGGVERLVLADGGTSIVLERQTNEIRGTGDLGR